MKRLIAIVVVLVLAGFGYTAYAKYEDYKFIEAMSPHVKNSSLRIANTLRYATEDGANITFRELFDNLESSISEIDKRILEVQTIETPSNKSSAEPVLTYLKGGQELLRAQLSAQRKAFSLNMALDQARRATVELRNSSDYGFDYAKKSADRSIEELKKAGEEMETADLGFLESSKKMVNLRNKAVDVMPADTLVDAAILDAVVKKMDEVVSKEKQAAESHAK